MGLVTGQKILVLGIPDETIKYRFHGRGLEVKPIAACQTAAAVPAGVALIVYYAPNVSKSDVDLLSAVAMNLKKPAPVGVTSIAQLESYLDENLPPRSAEQEELSSRLYRYRQFLASQMPATEEFNVNRETQRICRLAKAQGFEPVSHQIAAELRALQTKKREARKQLEKEERRARAAGQTSQELAALVEREQDERRRKEGLDNFLPDEFRRQEPPAVERRSAMRPFQPNGQAPEQSKPRKWHGQISFSEVVRQECKRNPDILKGRRQDAAEQLVRIALEAGVAKPKKSAALTYLSMEAKKLGLSFSRKPEVRAKQAALAPATRPEDSTKVVAIQSAPLPVAPQPLPSDSQGSEQKLEKSFEGFPLKEFALWVSGMTFEHKLYLFRMLASELLIDLGVPGPIAELTKRIKEGRSKVG